MTRINCVPVQELHDKHLVAEYRELPRVFKLARSNAKIPDTYRMGTGHVTFFYDKLQYLDNRLGDLHQEMKRRGYKTSFVSSFICFKDVNTMLWNDWIPDQKALNANRARLAVRTQQMRDRIHAKKNPS